MRDLNIGFQELETVLVKKRNSGIREYVMSLREEIDEISGRRDTAVVDLTMNNDILSRNFDTLVKVLLSIDGALDSIHKSLDVHSQAVDSVSAASEEMVRSSDSISENIVNQSSSLTEFASVLEEMSASIGSVANSTEEAKHIVDEVSTVTEQGNSFIEESVQSIEEIKESSEKITEITHVLQKIAGQSNLLAMNAAIEAAHAGDAGRGFAVVAEEMRKLSDNSREEAGKIADITKDIMLRIENAVGKTDRVIDNNKKLIEGIGRTNNITTQIRNAMQEQASGTEQVLQEVKSLNDLTSGMKSSVEEQKAANDHLLEAVAVMKDAAAGVEGMAEIVHGNRNEVVDITNKIGRTFIRNIDISSALGGRR